MNTVQAQIEVVESAGNLVPASILQFKSKVQSLKQAGVLLVESYYDVVTHVRDFQISPDVVTDTLKTEGFAPSRISEFKRIAFSVPQIYEEYKAKTIGFKLALKKSREAEKVKEEPSESSEDSGSSGDSVNGSGVTPVDFVKERRLLRLERVSQSVGSLLGTMTDDEFDQFVEAVEIILVRFGGKSPKREQKKPKKASATKTKTKK